MSDLEGLGRGIAGRREAPEGAAGGSPEEGTEEGTEESTEQSVAEGARLVELDEAECLRLISPGGVGRIAYEGRYGLTVLPVNYRMAGGAVVFRTTLGGSTDSDLRTGLEGVEYKVAFQVDRIDEATRTGWSVLVQGALHHVTDEELAQARATGVEPWAGGDRRQYLRITPWRLTGRRISTG